MATSPWTAEILDRFAKSVSYEARTCSAQLEEIVKEHGNNIPPPPTGFGPGGTPKDAMLQAGLMHLRSLDDFLRGKSERPAGRPPDIRARDWFDDPEVKYQWTTRFWLDPRDRSLIDWNIVHLSSMRTMETETPPFKLANYGEALCGEMERFFQAVEEHCDAARLEAFDYDVRGDLRRRAEVFSQNVSR